MRLKFSLLLFALAGEPSHRPVPAVLPVRAAADTLNLQFTIRQLPADSTPLVELQLILPPSRDSVTMLRLPSEWAGWNGLQDEILGLAATTPGARIEPGTDSASRRLIAPPGTAVTIRWQRRPSWKGQMPSGAHNLSDFDADWMQLIGYDAFVLPARDKSTPVRATFAFLGFAPGSVIATSFGSGNAAADTLVTAREMLGALEHAVYTAGSASAIRFFAVPYSPRHTINVAVRGALRIPDSALTRAVLKIVTAERTFWHDDGPPSYLVTVGQASRGTLAGTRLTNSFVADIDPARPLLDDGVLTLLAHEMMHDWLGGALQPAPGQADDHLIWFTEGFTDYLSQRVLWRAGILADSSYLTYTNRALHDYAMSPARDLPWSEIERVHWTNSAAQRQPYLRGQLFALRLDALARADAPNGATSHTVDRALLAMTTSDHGKPAELTEQSVIAGLSSVLGAKRTAQEVNALMHGSRRIEIPANLLGPCVVQSEIDSPFWEPGFDLDGSLRDPKHLVRAVRAGSRAAKAGLQDGMQLRSTSVWRGDIAKPIDLGVSTPPDTSRRHIVYSPVSDSTVRMTVLAGKPGCRM